MATDVFVRLGTIRGNIWSQLPALLAGHSEGEIVFREDDGRYHPVHTSAIQAAKDQWQGEGAHDE